MRATGLGVPVNGIKSPFFGETLWNAVNLLVAVALGTTDATLNQHLLLTSRCKNRGSWRNRESLLTQGGSRRETVSSYNKAAVDRPGLSSSQPRGARRPRGRMITCP
jgi:hypothetical protein